MFVHLAALSGIVAIHQSNSNAHLIEALSKYEAMDSQDLPRPEVQGRVCNNDLIIIPKECLFRAINLSETLLSCALAQ